MHLTNVHSLGPRSGIAQHDCHSEPSIPGSIPYPTQTSSVVEVILLDAVRVEFTRESDVRKRAAAGWREGVFAFDAVDVAIEETWIA